MVTATQRRRGVRHLKDCSACRLLGFSRSAAWATLKDRDDASLRSRLKELAERYQRYGYPTLHDMLSAEGLVVNRKRTYRVYREEGLQVRTKHRKKLIRPDVPMLAPDRPNVRWSMDFVSNQLANGGRFRVLNVVDDFSRECVLQIVNTSIFGQRFARALDQFDRPLPKTIVVSNALEFTCKSMFFWTKGATAKLHFIQPGKLTQNAFVESFNGKFRDYCMDLHRFANLEDVRKTIDTWRDHYNLVRPHRSLGRKPPAVFAQQAP